MSAHKLSKPDWADSVDDATLKILAPIAHRHGVKLADIFSDSKEVTHIRHACIRALRLLHGYKLQTIGVVFNLHHTTVIYAVKKNINYENLQDQHHHKVDTFLHRSNLREHLGSE